VLPDFKKIFSVIFLKVKKNKYKTNKKKSSDRCPITPGKKKENLMAVKFPRPCLLLLLIYWYIGMEE